MTSRTYLISRSNEKFRKVLEWTADHVSNTTLENHGEYILVTVQSSALPAFERAFHKEEGRLASLWKSFKRKK